MGCCPDGQLIGLYYEVTQTDFDVILIEGLEYRDINFNCSYLTTACRIFHKPQDLKIEGHIFFGNCKFGQFCWCTLHTKMNRTLAKLLVFFVM